MKMKTLSLVLMMGTLVACSSTPTETPSVNEDAVVENNDNGNGVSDDGNMAFLDVLKDPSSPLYNTNVYFDFDKHDLKSQDLSTLDAHAAFIAQHPTLRVTLEGYADERGTPEYNLALGERRAIAVQDYFMVHGVQSNQLDMTSYGEENPAVDGHNEAAWSKNRRVHIAYPGQ